MITITTATVYPWSQSRLLPNTITEGKAKFQIFREASHHFAEQVIREPGKGARLLEIWWTQYIVGLWINSLCTPEQTKHYFTKSRFNVYNLQYNSLEGLVQMIAVIRFEPLHLHTHTHTPSPE
jgi:hypothetical protein